MWPGDVEGAMALQLRLIIPTVQDPPQDTAAQGKRPGYKVIHGQWAKKHVAAEWWLLGGGFRSQNWTPSRGRRHNSSPKFLLQTGFEFGPQAAGGTWEKTVVPQLLCKVQEEGSHLENTPQSWFRPQTSTALRSSTTPKLRVGKN